MALLHSLNERCQRTPLRVGGLLSLLRSLWCASLGIALVLLYSETEAQTNSSAETPLGHRIIFIVETSSAMKDRSQGVVDAVQGLLNSGLKGQMKRGDAVDVWSFNDTVLKAGTLSQPWTPENKAVVSVRLLDFLLAQKYEKKARFEAMLPEMQRMLQESPLVTFILVTAGDHGIAGIPCEGQFDTTFKSGHDQQQKLHMPFVALVRGVNGLVLNCAVVTAPKPLIIPDLQAEPAVTKTEATSPPAPKPTPSNSVAAATPGPAQKTQPAVTNGVQGSTTVPNNSASKTAIAVNSNVVQPVATVSKPLRTNSAASSNMVAKAAVSPIPQPTTSLPEPPTPAPQAKTETIVEKSELTPTPQPSAVQEPSVATASSAVIPVPSQPVTETTETQLPKPLPPAQSSTPLATAAAQQLQMPPLVIQFPANATRPSFVRENGKWLLLVALAGAGACFCVFNWLRVVKRPAARRN